MINRFIAFDVRHLRQYGCEVADRFQAILCGRQNYRVNFRSGRCSRLRVRKQKILACNRYGLDKVGYMSVKVNR